MSGSWRCRRRGHDWFPPVEQREFLPTVSVCLRCPAREVTLPSGWCIRMGRERAHRLADHYGPDGNLVWHPLCPGPA